MPVLNQTSAAQTNQPKHRPRAIADWVRVEPMSALLLTGVLATLVVFFGFVPLFIKGVYSAGLTSTAGWAWQAWTGEQAHSKLVVLISLGLVCYRWKEIRNAPKRGANWGLSFVVAGILLFLLSARCLQPRIALASLPFLIFGAVVYLWGPALGRIVFFPCAFLIFLVPVAALEQVTFRLQFLITEVVTHAARLLSIHLNAVGTTITAADGSFNFEIAEGCSGIRSLTAMTMLAAVYVHLTQDRLWKKIVIFVSSVVFAIVGNIGRILTVIIVAKLIDPKLAFGIYHDYSDFVFFPIALFAMLLFGRLVNLGSHEGPAGPPAPDKAAVSV
jgi:exosortase